MQIFNNAHFDFVGVRKWAFLFSGVLILAGVLSIVLHGGFDLGIDFTGGVKLQVQFADTIGTDELTRIRTALAMDVYSVGTAGDEVVIRHKSETSAQQIARSILARRDELGVFTSLDQLAGIEFVDDQLLETLRRHFVLDADLYTINLDTSQQKPALNKLDEQGLTRALEGLIERETNTRITSSLLELWPPITADGSAPAAGAVDLNSQSSAEDYMTDLTPLLGADKALMISGPLAEARNLVSVQTTSLLSDWGQVEEMARQAGLDEEDLAKLRSGAYLSAFYIQSVNVIGPKVGDELGQSAVWAIMAALAGLLIYISLRFEFSFSIGAIIALAHDVTITLGIFSLLGKEINLTIIAAILTLIGYSLNDTIVVYDRIREDRKLLRRRTLPEIINTAVNETLSRTILTSGTTLMVTVVLVFFGGSVIHDFALALTIGIIIGTYSSVFIASPFILWWHNIRRKTQA